MNELFSFYFLVFLPVFYIGGPNGCREYLSIIGATLFWMVELGSYVLYGNPISIPPMSILLFGAWLCLSVLWSKHKENSMIDLLTLLSILTAFCAVRQISMDLALLFCFLPAPGIALNLLKDDWKYRQQIIMGTNTDRPGGIFGNCNHTGVYLALTTLIGVWISQEVSLIYLPFTMLCAAAAICTRSRNAQTSLLLGIASIFFFSKQWEASLLILILGAAFAFFFPKHSGDRDLLARKAFQLIIKKPFYGWGLNTFRIEHGYYDPPYQTHRVHNDWFEFWYEIGLIGMALMYFIYASVNWSLHPVLAAQVVVGLWSALWFFSWREIHTAMPIIGLLAVMIPNDEFRGSMLAVLLLIAVPKIIWFYVAERILGLYWYALGSRKKTKEEQYAYLKEAIRHDRNSVYLSRAAFCASVNRENETAFDNCMEALYNYDGYVVLASLCDQAARASMMMGAVAVSDYMNRKSLELDKGFLSSLEFKQKIDELKGKLMVGGTIPPTSISTSET